MVDNMPEKLIKFPISEWIVQSVHFQTDLPSEAYCICYQYNIDSNGYGPYGFLTEKSEGLLSFLFNNLLCFNKEDKTLDVCSTLSRNGVYFYGNNNEQVHKQLADYRRMLLKNKLRANKGLPEEVSPEKPDLLNLYDDYGGVDVSVINYLMEKGYQFLFYWFFTPVAGESVIVFDCNIWDRAIEYCKKNGIDFQEVDSVDNLKEW
ncbi:hypothetical protein ACQ3G4_07675 [bacterium BS0013]